MTLILCDSETYKKFLAYGGSGAQRLLDLVQDVRLVIGAGILAAEA
jgi:hypothetical protein